MITHLIQLELYVLTIILTFIVALGAFIRKKNDLFQRILVNFSIFLFIMILGNSIKPLATSTTWLIGYFLFGTVSLVLMQTPVTTVGLLICNIVLASITIFIPFDILSFGSFLSFDLIIFVVNIIVLGMLYIQYKKRNQRLSNLLAVTCIGLVTAFFVDDIYHLSSSVIVLAVIAWYTYDYVTHENKLEQEAVLDKLDKLENEFNYELRKEVNKHTFHLKEVQEKMSHINKIDNLTQAYNKKAIFNIIEKLAADRRMEQFAIIMFDLDNFKRLNDTLGHVQGDICLKTLASIARDCIRDSDSLGRYGGDEFMIVLPNASLSTAVTIAERFRDNIDKKTQPHFTISCGLACYPEDGESLKALLDIADKGLYRSKEKGRNAVSYDNPKYEKKY